MKTTLSLSAIAVILISIFSCNKIQTDQFQNSSYVNNSIVNNKLATDDWASISKIPLIISQDYLYRSNTMTNTSNSSLRFPKTITLSDITPPTVTITSPTNGSSISGTISIAVSASDNVGVSSVSVTIDGAILSTLTTSPYNFSWNSSSVIDGTHTITATAKDAKSNASSSTISVTKNTTIITPPITTLPSSAFLITPPIANQGNEGSCVAFSCAYGARSIEQYYRTNATSYNVATNLFSPEYVYNQTKFSADCNSGTAFTLVLGLMKNKGVATWESMPYSDLNGCSLLPTANQDANAASYKIISYSKIINSDQIAIKTMIYNHHPLMINIIMDNSFINATPGFIWRNNSGSGSMPHALIICGYDDSKHAYKVMNSFGTNWGDAGYSWIDYDYFPLVSSYYLYVMNY